MSSNMDMSNWPLFRTWSRISATNWTLAMEEAKTEKDKILFNLQLILILIGGFNFQPTWNGQIGSSSQLLGQRKNVPSHQPEYYWSESVRNTNWQKEPESKTKIHSSRRSNVSGSLPEWSPRSESGSCQLRNAPPVVDAQDGFSGQTSWMPQAWAMQNSYDPPRLQRNGQNITCKLTNRNPKERIERTWKKKLHQCRNAQ